MLSLLCVRFCVVIDYLSSKDTCFTWRKPAMSLFPMRQHCGLDSCLSTQTFHVCNCYEYWNDVVFRQLHCYY